MKLIPLVLFVVLITSCAQIQNPAGGTKDEQPPKIEKAVPEIGQTNFNGTELKVVFDEFVVLGNLAQEAIVSPPSLQDPEYKVNNKTLKITFPELLSANTTYTINLGEGIKDFHEGIPLDSNLLVFSTGNYIDSLNFSGTVKNGFDLTPEPDVLVLLFENQNDSTPSKERPYYYTKTDKEGNFKFQYLKNGTFSIFAVADKNSDRLYNLPNEKIGFLDREINTQNVDSIYTIKLFEPNNKKQFVVSLKEKSEGKIVLILNAPAKMIGLEILGKTFKKEWYESDTIAGDTINLWTDLARYEDQEVEIEISADNEILDTVKLRLKAFDTINIQRPIVNCNIQSGVAKYFEPLFLTTDIPIRSFQDSLLLKIGQSDSNMAQVLKVGSKKLKVNYVLEQEKNYELIIPDSFITDILDFKSKGSTQKFKTKSDVEYGNLKLNVELTSKEKLILQFMSKDGAILQEHKFVGNKTFNYPNLSPGEYQLKMIFDRDQNGKWTTGTYIPRNLPERVIFYSEKLEMKEGWDKEITWIIPE